MKCGIFGMYMSNFAGFFNVLIFEV